MTPKIVKVERTQYFDYRPFTPSFMLVNQLEEEARRQERIQEEKEIKENRNNRGLFNFLLLPKRRRNENRSIWEGIHSGQVFTVCFKKQDKPESKRKLQEEIDAIVEQFSNSIDTVKNSKKGVANAAKNLITELVNNPVLPYEEGEDRVLRGYKIQFESRDGRYDCVDMDIVKTDKESGIRPVNINTIHYLIYNGVKYIVE